MCIKFKGSKLKKDGRGPSFFIKKKKMFSCQSNKKLFFLLCFFFKDQTNFKKNVGVFNFPFF